MDPPMEVYSIVAVVQVSVGGGRHILTTCMTFMDARC